MKNENRVDGEDEVERNGETRKGRYKGKGWIEGEEGRDGKGGRRRRQNRWDRKKEGKSGVEDDVGTESESREPGQKGT